MSIDHDFPQSSIERSAPVRPVESGAFDDGLSSPREDSAYAAQRDCHLAETFFHEGRCDDALECGRRAFALAGDDEEVARCCAWLFSNAGLHSEAAEAYERLLDRHPDWIEGYRHLSGSLAASGNRDAAIDNALRATELAPSNFDFALHAGRLLLDAQRPAEAMFYLRRAVDIEPQNPHALRALSATE